MATTDVTPTQNALEALTAEALQLNLLRTCPVELSTNYFMDDTQKNRCTVTVNGDCSDEKFLPDNSFILGNDGLLHEFTVKAKYDEIGEATIFTIKLTDGTALPEIKNEDSEYAQYYDHIVKYRKLAGEITKATLTNTYKEEYDLNNSGTVTISDFTVACSKAMLAPDGTNLDPNKFRTLWIIKFYTPSVVTGRYDHAHEIVETGVKFDDAIETISNYILSTSCSDSSINALYDVNKDGRYSISDIPQLVSEKYQFVQNDLMY